MAITITFNDEQLSKLKGIMRRECFAKYVLERERQIAEELYSLVAADQARLDVIVDFNGGLFSDMTSTVPVQVFAIDEDDASEFIGDETSAEPER
jgi:hypothetical protein